jgi:hypothetical protein
MEHARGSRALREGRALEQLDARVAGVAAHLGMADEAAQLYTGCGRHDLLNDLHRAGGRWDQVCVCGRGGGGRGLGQGTRAAGPSTRLLWPAAGCRPASIKTALCHSHDGI